MATITLTAGDLSSFFGAGSAGYADGVAGSISGGFLLNVAQDDSLYENGSNVLWACLGNQVAALTGLTHIKIDGVNYPVTSAPAYDGNFTTEVQFAYKNFVPATDYTISLVGVPAVITSAAAVDNLIETTLAHTITVEAGKTIASVAITGGADAAAFEINGTATLRFASNVASTTVGPLVVEITVTDGDGLTRSQTITVTVKAIVFKGSKVYSRPGSTSSANSSLTDLTNPLTGATGIAAAIGDTVVIFLGIGSTADRNMVITTAGYVEHADHYVNGTTYDANIGLFTKTLTATDTNVTIGSSGNSADAQAAVIMLFRGVDATTPMDVAAVLNQGTGTGNPNPAAITPGTTGAVGIFGGAQASVTAANFTSSDLIAFRTTSQVDNNDIAIGAGFIEWASGSLDPAEFGGGVSAAGNSWATVSAVLRPAWVGSGSDYSLTIGNLATDAPTIGNPVLAQNHSLTPSILSTGTPTLGTPSLTQKHDLTPAGLSAGAPTLGTPTFNISVALVLTGISTDSPVLGTPVVSHRHVLTIAALATGAPVVGASTVSQLHNMSMSSLSAGSPVMGAPALTGTHSLTTVGIATGSPVLGSPSITHRHVFTITSLASGVPVFDTPTLISGNTLAPIGLTTGVPVVGSPTVSQRHVLSIAALSTGAPVLGSATILQRHVLEVVGLTSGVPILGTPTLVDEGSSVTALTPNGISAGVPSLGSPVLTGRHVLTIAGLATPNPSLGTPVVLQRHVVSIGSLNAGAPTLGTPALTAITVTYFIIPVGLTTGEPITGMPAIAQRHDFTTIGLSTGEPILGNPALSDDLRIVPIGVTAGVPVLGNCPLYVYERDDLPGLHDRIYVAKERQTIIIPELKSRLHLAKDRDMILVAKYREAD